MQWTHYQVLEVTLICPIYNCLVLIKSLKTPCTGKKRFNSNLIFSRLQNCDIFPAEISTGTEESAIKAPLKLLHVRGHWLKPLVLNLGQIY